MVQSRMLCILLLGWGAAAHAQDTVRIPLSHRAKAIIPNTIHVQVGGGPDIPVLFDTGSSGLRVLAQDLGPDVRRTDRRVHEAYGDGTVVEGYVGYARIDFPEAEPRIGTREIAIEVIERVTCRSNRPHCPGIAGLGRGVMGVDYKPAGPIFNPLAQLPGPHGEGFVVDIREGQRPHVRVGLPAGDRAAFRFADMPPAPPAESGQPGWNTGALIACYAVDDRPVGCQPVIFDTGGSSMHFTFDHPPHHLVRHGHLAHGRRVTMRVGNLLEITEVVRPDSPVRLSPERRSNSGEAFFRRFAVAFDSAQGRIGFLR